MEGHRRGNGTCWVRMQRQVADDENSPKGGDWTSEEIAKLRELVDEYFQQNTPSAPGRGAGEGNEHLQVRDNINWKTIATEVGDPKREQLYAKVVPPRISPDGIESGQWGEGQDKILIEAVIRSGAESEVDVPWGGSCAWTHPEPNQAPIQAAETKYCGSERGFLLTKG